MAENNELEDLFNEENAKIPETFEKTKSFADGIIEQIENEYLGNLKDPIKEKRDLEIKLKKLKISMKNCKNIKNHKRTDINSKMALKRKLYKEEITKIKDKLYELYLEDKGSQLSSDNIIEKSGI